MSVGMADIIAAHTPSRWRSFSNDNTVLRCCGQDFGNATKPRQGDDEKAHAAHAAHVAEELAKAGYGILPDVAPEYGARVMQLNGLSAEPHPQGSTPNSSWFSKSTHVRLVGPWQELQTLPDPLAAAMQDQEGRALVQAIHDRKAASHGD